MKTAKKYIFAAFFSIFVVLWLAFVFGNSAQSGVESGNLSSDVCRIINTVFEPIFGRPVSELFVRKAAHFTEYAILAALFAADAIVLIRAFTDKSRGSAAAFSWLSVLASFCTALIDEFVVQASTVGRGPSFIDVLIDTLGAVIGVPIILFCYLFIYRRRVERLSGVSAEQDAPSISRSVVR